MNRTVPTDRLKRKASPMASVKFNKRAGKATSVVRPLGVRSHMLSVGVHATEGLFIMDWRASRFELLSPGHCIYPVAAYRAGLMCFGLAYKRLILREPKA